jgi:hypothetical protein
MAGRFQIDEYAAGSDFAASPVDLPVDLDKRPRWAA